MKPSTKQLSNKNSPACREELRCDCGCLIAKVMEEGIEIKCRRCKRLAVIPYSDIQEMSGPKVYHLG